ncbi:complement inhibitor SCIN family protein [Staphylococcus aureus]|uniref:complement inhibitor SCIN family protein n=1 Tax=Staphylococcus aureus TaxID=1280 RepID=UPI0038900C48
MTIIATQSKYHDKKCRRAWKSLLRQSNVYDLADSSLNRYYKRTIMMNEYRAKLVPKKMISNQWLKKVD